MAEVVAVDHIQRSRLAATDHEVRIRATVLIGNNHCSATQIEVFLRQVYLVEWCEPIGNGESAGRAKLQERVTIISSARIVCVEIAVACQQIDIALGIGRRASPGHPDAAAPAVNGVVEDADLGKSGSAVADQPAMIKVLVVVACPANINNSVQEQEPRALLLHLRSESDGAVDIVVPRAAYGRRNHHRRVGTLLPRGYVNRMQSLDDRACSQALCHSHEVDGLRGWIDYRCASNAGNWPQSDGVVLEIG